MFMPRFARSMGWLVAVLLAACSNGRGSLEEQPTPPAAPSQGTYSIGGTVTGLVGAGLVLQNNGGDDSSIVADGAFTFATTLANEATYSVTVRTQPTTQNCVVENASGTVANANVTNVQVSCATNQFTVGGSVSGLEGTGLVLRLNDGNDLLITSNGPFAFSTALLNDTSFTATVFAQPTNPSQECTLANGSGTIAGANVANLEVTCVTRSFTVGGTVSGLAGTGLAVRLNGTQDLPIMGNGSFTFPTALPSGTSYTLTFVAQPVGPVQVCTASNVSGTVRDENITSIAVSCATQTFAVGGTVSGLLGNGLRLRNSNGELLAIAADGTFVFPTKVASGASYAITVETAPSNPTQACTIANGTGTIVGSDITNVAVSCSTRTFTVGGNAHNVLGSGLILRNDGGDDLQVVTSGPFTFATAIPSGSNYSITVAQQPNAPSQTCEVENGSGAVGAGPVTNVQVRCTTNGFLIGGQVTGLLGSGLQLQNGADRIAIAADGPFQFPTAVPSGIAYTVLVLTQPVAPVQTCIVINGIGLVGNQDVTSVQVRCQTIGLPPF